MSTLAVSRSAEPQSRTAVLGRSVIVRSQIFSREDLIIDGEFEGTVEMQEHRLTIGPNGKIRASVKVRERVVLGTVHGDVETTDKVDVRKDAKLIGNIRTPRIVIEDGAYFKGNIDIIRAEVPRPARMPQAASVDPGSVMVDIDSAAARDLDAIAEADIRQGRFDQTEETLEDLRAEWSF